MIRVVKLGGSLLEMPHLAERLRDWLASQTTAHHVIVVGGGALVEQIRQWHAAQAIDDRVAHWMCVDLMSVTAELLHARMPDAPLTKDDRLLRARLTEPGVTIFDPARWLREVEPGLPGRQLPCSWSTTSDAIAGRLTAAIQAHELSLLKSALPDSAATLEELAAGGYVDLALAALAPELPSVRLVNLRSPAMAEVRLPRPDERAADPGQK